MNTTELEDRACLTDEQQQVHDALVAYATGEDTTHAMMVMKGYAGTGKTFTITEVIRTLKSPLSSAFDTGALVSTPSIAVSAPTHKAVRVLRKFSNFAKDVEFATIHSLLGLREEIDDHGRIKYVQSKDPEAARIEEFDVLIIDEASMLSDELFVLLVPYVHQGTKIIFIGDPVQIPPVNHPDSIPFKDAAREKYNIGLVELSKIMRQALDNPILTYATRIRKAYKTQLSFDVDTHKVDRGSVYGFSGIIRINTGDEPAIKQVLKEYFCCEEFKSNADHMKVIAWRNSIVNGFNLEIRKLIYDQKDLPLLMEGEKLIVDKPVILPTGRILLTTNEEIEVKSYEIKYGKYEYMTGAKIDGSWTMQYREESFKYYDTWVEFYNHRNQTETCNIRILHEDEEKRFWRVLEGIKQAAMNVGRGSPLRNKLWVSFYKAQKLFAQVKYNYAITGHKSQGSTYDNCLVVDWDIDYNRNIEERNRIRYVAATRARNLLFIVK